MKFMEITTLSVGAFEENASVMAFDNGSAWIVDPGADAERIAAVLDAQHLAPAAILLTHGHFDHICAIADLQGKYGEVPVYIHAADKIMLGHAWNQFPPQYPIQPPPKNLHSGEWPQGVDVIETPGHTPGSVSFYFKDAGVVLTGDTLFAGSAGRTDFPGGSFAALKRSLAVLAKLPPATRVIPGHGNDTTIERELATNPFYN